MKNINNIKKVVILSSLLLFVMLVHDNVRGDSYQLDFNYIVDKVGIPSKNKKGESLNEEIYRKYNIFVYSDPIRILKETNIQRFKEVQKDGKYFYNGKLGEFYILGTNFEGAYVYNVFFPVDFIPDTYPENWRYLALEEFKNSWNQSCMYKEQLDYMKNTKLLFDKIDLINKTCNSYDLVEYNLIPIKYGLEKFRLNSLSTWKTMGIITAKRILKNGSLRDVIFMTKPMAVEANIYSYLNVKDEAYINETEDETSINIEFGSAVKGLTEYANKNQIKKIYSEIYIDGILIDSICGSKIANVDKKIDFVISREKDNLNEKVMSYLIEVKSYLLTDFLEDGILYDELEKNVVVKVAPRKLVPINNISIKLLTLEENYWVVSPLVQMEELNIYNQGFFEQGREVAVYIEGAKDFKRISDIKIYLNNIECKYKLLKSNESFLYLEPEIIGKTHLSLGGWKSMREEKENYFDVNVNDIGKRIKDQNIMQIKVLCTPGKEEIYTLYFDVIDYYINNVNRTLPMSNKKEYMEEKIKFVKE